MIVVLGEWILERACEYGVLLEKAGLATCVAVNVSGVQLARADFVATVLKVLDKTGLAPGRLDLEVTETFLMRDVEHA